MGEKGEGKKKESGEGLPRLERRCKRKMEHSDGGREEGGEVGKEEKESRKKE